VGSRSQVKEALRVTGLITDALDRRDIEAVAGLCSPTLVVYAPGLGLTDRPSLIRQLSRLLALCEESRYQVEETTVTGTRVNHLAVIALRSSRARTTDWVVGTAHLAYEVDHGRVGAAWVNADLPALLAQWNGRTKPPAHSMRSQVAQLHFDPEAHADPTIRLAEWPTPTPARRSRKPLAALAAAFVIIAGITAWTILPFQEGEDSPQSSRPPPAKRAAPPPATPRAVTTGPPPFAATPPGVTAVPVPGGVAVRVSETVLFDGNSARLRPGAVQLIKSIAAQLRRARPSKVDVLGHTADVGPGDGSELSQRRADAVADVLLDALAGLPLTVKAKGLGESQPVAPNDTEQNRSRNRRVEIIYATP
jgi:outer membrane protein OmpA-like peptidoglycan-associated protein